MGCGSFSWSGSGVRAGRRGRPAKILFMGCHHAREWIAVEVTYLLAKELVEPADDPH